ncbi:hypothetical protein [Pseudomonas sp. PSKL.D1]|uniref:hypothetical protein n=1 Tax=Pseudomonas sp. PSKL.D1 TaxID=3029060 RepID=UPI00238192C0|nr:hypothetical protein [Pseudomonas sp. PSKL.D1]WDY57887.1 hypothetical protein PVV54_25535 [Pseudomonas sp. PSKL.D1]
MNTVLVITASMLLLWMSIGVGMMIYLACLYLEIIEYNLSRCRYVQDNKANFAAAGLVGRVLRACLAANMLMMPKLFIWKGAADAEEVLRFPVRLKRKLMISWGGLVISGVVFFIFSAVVRQ